MAAIFRALPCPCKVAAPAAPKTVAAAPVVRCLASLGPNHSRRALLTMTRVAMAERAEATAESTFASLMDEDEDGDEYEDDQEVVKVRADEVVDESLKVVNLGLCADTVKALTARGISSLFAIQKAVFKPATEGRDLIGRAKTGSGKTLAFALPVVESLLKEDKTDPPRRGRSPRCIVLAPTRELANQVAKEFETVCPGLKVASFYGGTSINNQIRELERGIDVVVGTPGRVIDLINRKFLRLEKVRYAILDEADQMLDMGFEEDMETILSYVPQNRQTMLFSATMPKWVNKIARRYQQNPLLVDLVGSEDTGKLCDSIRMLLMQVDHSQKVNALMDSISLYAMGGKTIVFVNTKIKADEICDYVAQVLPCVALHGDISQQMRDRGLQAFRDGKYQVLVATDVAARGLDIPNVDLVAHYDVPVDAESFLHRSGRTGRAGKLGTAVVLFTERETREVGRILKTTKTETAEMIGAPAPADVMTSASRNVLTQLDKVDNGVIDFFVPAAEKLMLSEQPTRVLAAALAAMSGYRKPPQPRSLLTYEEGLMTVRVLSAAGTAVPVDGWNSLVKALKLICKKAKITKDFEFSIGKMKVLGNQDGLDGAVFDLPFADAQLLLKGASAAATLGYTVDKASVIKVDVSELLVGGGGRSGPPRADRSSRSWGSDRGSDRSGGFRDRKSFGSSRGGGGSFGGADGGWGGQGQSRSGSASGYGSSRGGSGYVKDAGAGKSSWGGGDMFYADNDYFGSSSRGAASGSRRSSDRPPRKY